MIFQATTLTAFCAMMAARSSVAEGSVDRSWLAADNGGSETTTTTSSSDSFVPRKIQNSRLKEEVALIGKSLKNPSPDMDDGDLEGLPETLDDIMDMMNSVGILDHRLLQDTAAPTASAYPSSAPTVTASAAPTGSPTSSSDDCAASCVERPLIPNDPSFKTQVKNYFLTESLNITEAFSPYNQPLNCWNTSQVTDMSFAFEDQETFNGPLDCWDTSSVTAMRRMFSYAKDFNQPLDTFDTSKVTDMNFMFRGAYDFNNPVDSWDVSKVIDMDSMFKKTKNFNQDLASWSPSSVTTFSRMFEQAEAFNQPIGWTSLSAIYMSDMFADASVFNSPVGSLDTSSLLSAKDMFKGAVVFDQPLNSWNISSVTRASGMFCGAAKFNQPLNRFDTSRVKTMTDMFEDAIAFNQPLTSWDVALVTSMSGMFTNATSFNQCLSTWASRVNPDATVTGMFAGSGCPEQGDPSIDDGPWCQGSADMCIECADSPRRVKFDFDGNKRWSCFKIQQRAANAPQPDRVIRGQCKKRATLRDGSSGTRSISRLCPQMCKVCPDQCQDSKAKFTLDGGSKTRKCQFIADKNEPGRKRFCNVKNATLLNGKTKPIKNLCVETCGKLNIGRCNLFLGGMDSEEETRNIFVKASKNIFGHAD